MHCFRPFVASAVAARFSVLPLLVTWWLWDSGGELPHQPFCSFSAFPPPTLGWQPKVYNILNPRCILRPPLLCIPNSLGRERGTGTLSPPRCRWGEGDSLSPPVQPLWGFWGLEMMYSINHTSKTQYGKRTGRLSVVTFYIDYMLKW